MRTIYVATIVDYLGNHRHLGTDLACHVDTGASTSPAADDGSTSAASASDSLAGSPATPESANGSTTPRTASASTSR